MSVPRETSESASAAGTGRTSHAAGTAHDAKEARAEKLPPAPSPALERLEKRLNEDSTVNMLSVPEIIESKRVYNGRIFSVDDRRIMLQETGARSTVIGRQIVRHARSVVMMVHDTASDKYLIEREYRVGSNTFAFGFPAGLRDPGESALQSAFRELREETGITVPGIPNSPDDPDFTASGVRKALSASADVTVDVIGDFFSSVGMTDELTCVMVLHLNRYAVGKRDFDPDEHVESGWVTWDELRTVLPIRSTNTVLAIQHEEIRRLRESLDATRKR